MSDTPAPAPQPDAIAAQKSNFLATISHELRTPMQSVYGLMELIQQQNKDPVISDMINAAQNSAGLMLDLLDDILDFARLDADRLELEQLEIPMRTLVQGVVEALQVKVANRPVELLARVDDEVPTIILGDPKRLRQILFNLVANALKFTADGKVTIHVGYDGTNAAAPMLRLSVIDTGMGIDPSVHGKLFQPFTQADSSTARKFGGTGLGLSICRKLVTLMGGDIGLISAPGQGATFWFTMPCVIADANSDRSMIDLSGLSLLVVEDHPQGAIEIERSLKQMNADVHVVPDLFQARVILQRQRFDVAIIDYALPDGYGTELIREAVAAYPRMGQILYTVHEYDGMQQMLAALGVTYLSKPASRQGLGQAVLDVARRQWRYSEKVIQKVLIAEDTESICDLLAMQMRKLGVTADIVHNGLEALGKISSNQYGLLLTDLHMPVMDGYKMIQRLRATEATDSRLPVILLTADVQVAQRSAYTKFGFDDCLLKPMTFNHLRHALERWGIQCAAADGDGNVPDILPDLFNIPQLAANMGSTPDDARAMLRAFPKLCAPLIDRINQAVAQDDMHELAEAAHSLKGAARSACCERLGDMAAQLQNGATQKTPVDNLIPAINTMFAAACSEIDALSAT